MTDTRFLRRAVPLRGNPTVSGIGGSRKTFALGYQTPDIGYQISEQISGIGSVCGFQRSVRISVISFLISGIGRAQQFVRISSNFHACAQHRVPPFFRHESPIFRQNYFQFWTLESPPRTDLIRNAIDARCIRVFDSRVTAADCQMEGKSSRRMIGTRRIVVWVFGLTRTLRP